MNNTIKDYYIKLSKLYTNCTNMLTALNQSLSSSSPQIVINLEDNDGTENTVTIPSFLYLENKLDTLENSLSNLINIPNSGDAWFENNSNMYKIHMIKSNVAPQKPIIDGNNIVTSFTDNNYFKDLVSPKLYLKLNISNLTNNIEKIFVRKFTFNKSIFDAIKDTNIKTNDEYLALLYNYVRGNDYDYYDSTVDLPIKFETYDSEFKILDIPELLSGNPWKEINENNKENLNYKIIVDTLEYKHQEDSSIKFRLKIGDYISLNNSNSIYLIKSINTSTNEIIIEEYIGHSTLQTFEENQNMFFTYYDNNFSEYNYIQIPLEEDQYIAIFIGNIYNGIRSNLSNGIIINLNEIMMTDEFGNFIYDSSGNKLSYIEYYKEYAKNIGDILYGLSNISNPLLSEYSFNDLNELQESEVIQQLVSLTINSENIKVVPINKHIIDDKSSQNIINLHQQKNELNNKLTSVNSNIDTLYNTLTNTDWSQEVSISQISIQKKLSEYYTERTQLITQLNNVIDNINSQSIVKYTDDLKYRIRGLLYTDELEKFIESNFNNVKIIGIDVQYKYKSLYNETTSLSTISNFVFSDWNQYISKDKERITVLNDSKSKMNVLWEVNSTTDNIIKWNQIDIPINQNEDVIIKVRFKYNIGQPFINLYTQWSDETTIVFPTEYKELKEIRQIIDQNNDDTIIASFNKTLINDGYTEHNNNKLISNNQTFFHMPENIYSGFNTSENNLISLKDKLLEMSTNIDKYKELIEQSINAKYSVYLEFDNETIELFTGSINRININDNNISDSFIKKNLRIIIKNSGEYPVKLYSQFPGNSDIALIEDNRETYNRTIGNYERVPLLMNNEMNPQFLGQWIYFRQNNPYTQEDIYLNDENQKMQDVNNIESSLIWQQNYNNYIRNNNSQILWPYKEHGIINTSTSTRNIWRGLLYNENSSSDKFRVYNITSQSTTIDIHSYDNKNRSNFYKYSNVDPGSNIYLMRFEDMCFIDGLGEIVSLTENDNISEFNTTGKEFINNTILDYNGAFLYPDIMHKNNIIIDNTDIIPNNYIIIEPGKELSIPIVFEYCLGNITNNIENPITSISKSLYFDIKDSLFLDPKNYMLEISVNSNYSNLNNYLDGLRIASSVNTK